MTTRLTNYELNHSPPSLQKFKGHKAEKDDSELLHGNAKCKLLCGGVGAGVLLCGWEGA